MFSICIKGMFDFLNLTGVGMARLMSLAKLAVLARIPAKSADITVPA
jgi:hypothetical protein